MPITSNRYVDITSAVGGGEAVPTRELLLRLYTTNERVPTGSVISFSASSLETSLRDYFGSSSGEYARAAYYFGFISKVVTSPKNIQFARWADTDTSAQVFGSEAADLVDIQAYTTGAFDIVLGGVTFNITGLDFSLDATYADVATTLQTAIQLEGGALAAATVVYNATRTAFEFDTNGTADGDISFAEVTAGMLDDLGWGANAIFSNGIAAQTVTDVLSETTSLNNNFGSYNFIPTLTNDQIEESAIFANGRNIEFMYLLQVLDTNKQAIYDLINGYASCGMTLNDPDYSDEYPELLPGALLASLNYDEPAASANFMYYQDSRLTPTVTTDSKADEMDAVLVNYMGETQEAGVNLTFYQRGVLTGGSTAPRAMGVHANEQWLKSYLKSQFLNMFLALQQVAADESGQAIGTTYLEAGISQALGNGSIAQGKTLTTTQINYITQITGDSEAYKDVQGRGYWYRLSVDATDNEMTYLLIYAKRDSVDKVEGRHSLI